MEYGKRLELMVNHKELLATFMFMEWMAKNYMMFEFLSGYASLEHWLEKKKLTPDDIQDCTKEYLEYASEELSIS